MKRRTFIQGLLGGISAIVLGKSVKSEESPKPELTVGGVPVKPVYRFEDFEPIALSSEGISSGRTIFFLDEFQAFDGTLKVENEVEDIYSGSWRIEQNLVGRAAGLPTSTLELSFDSDGRLPKCGDRVHFRLFEASSFRSFSKSEPILSFPVCVFEEEKSVYSAGAEVVTLRARGVGPIEWNS